MVWKRAQRAEMSSIKKQAVLTRALQNVFVELSDKHFISQTS